MPLARVSGQLFAAPVDRRFVRLVPILLVSCVVALPLAAASLADPLWNRGVYDGGDYDNLMALFSDLEWSGVGLALTLPPFVTCLVPPTDPALKSSRLGSARHTRSPPSF